MNYMNVFFTAQKQNVVIDVCALDQHLSLLQQGCDITNGLYLKVPQLQGLLQYLLVVKKSYRDNENLFKKCFLVGIFAWASSSTETCTSTPCKGGL